MLFCVRMELLKFHKFSENVFVIKKLQNMTFGELHCFFQNRASKAPQSRWKCFCNKNIMFSEMHCFLSEYGFQSAIKIYEMWHLGNTMWHTTSYNVTLWRHTMWHTIWHHIMWNLPNMTSFWQKLMQFNSELHYFLSKRGLQNRQNVVIR